MFERDTSRGRVVYSEGKVARHCDQSRKELALLSSLLSKHNNMRNSQSAKRSYFFFSVFCIVAFLNSSVTEARFGGISQQIKAEQILTPESGYLYLGTTDSEPVIDFNGTTGRPDFLYSPETGPRVVEFYAPWCPHVSHNSDTHVTVNSDSKFDTYLTFLSLWRLVL